MKQSGPVTIPTKPSSTCKTNKTCGYKNDDKVFKFGAFQAVSTLESEITVECQRFLKSALDCLHKYPMVKATFINLTPRCHRRVQ